MLSVNWSDPWVIGTLAGVGGVLALVGVTLSPRSRPRVRAAALTAGFLGIAGLAAAAAISVHALDALRHPAAPAPRAPERPALSAQEALERFRKATPAERLALLSRLPADEPRWHTVGRGDVVQRVVERGTVEPVLCTDLACQVRGRADGKPVTTIKSVLGEGTPVKKGQLLLELDDAPLREQLKEAKAAGDAAAQRVKELAEDIARCKIVAPHAGMLIYYVPEQARFGAGTSSVVAQGEPVRQGQKLLRVCDLSKMQARTRVHEALVARVRAGQAARVRVDAFPGRALAGRVTHVSEVASQQDWLTADVKVYPVTVALEGGVDGLKPGMSAEVGIDTGRRPGVLRLPVHALLRDGDRRVCYVKQGDGVEERQVTTGLSDGAFVEVTAGLKGGEPVLANPRQVAERLWARGAEPRPRGRDVVAQSVLPRSVEADGRRSRNLAYGLTYDDLRRLAALPGVVRVVPVRGFPQELRRRERLHRGRVIATTPAHAEAEGLGLAEGRFFTDEEDEGRVNAAVLGAAAAERLFPDETALDRTVVVGRSAFVVVGVLRERGAAEEAPDRPAGGDVYVPLRTCQARFGPTVVVRRSGTLRREQLELTRVTLTLARADQVGPTVEAARALLQAAHAPQKDWEVLAGAAD